MLGGRARGIAYAGSMIEVIVSWNKRGIDEVLFKLVGFHDSISHDDHGGLVLLSQTHLERIINIMNSTHLYIRSTTR